MKHLMIGLINLYRKYISPLKKPCCRFTPTCSAYAIEAFEKRGFFVGFILTVWRILRCNPFCKGGYDPVPERGFRNPEAIRNKVQEDFHGECCEDLQEELPTSSESIDKKDLYREKDSDSDGEDSYNKRDDDVASDNSLD